MHPLQVIWLNAHAVEEGIKAWDAISLKAESINEQESYASFFGLVQRWSINSSVLATCKIYDRPNSRYPTICIQSFIDGRNKSSWPGEIDLLIKDMPTIEKDAALEHIFYYRDKVAAHQEKRDENVHKLLDTLPPIEEFQRLAAWAKKFTQEAGKILDVGVPTSALCAGMMTKNVIFKCLHGQLDEKSPEYHEIYSKFMSND